MIILFFLFSLNVKDIQHLNLQLPVVLHSKTCLQLWPTKKTQKQQHTTEKFK